MRLWSGTSSTDRFRCHRNNLLTISDSLGSREAALTIHESRRNLQIIGNGSAFGKDPFSDDSRFSLSRARAPTMHESAALRTAPSNRGGCGGAWKGSRQWRWSESASCACRGLLHPNPDGRTAAVVENLKSHAAVANEQIDIYRMRADSQRTSMHR